MLEVLAPVQRVERLHVPFVHEKLGEWIPLFVSVTEPRIRSARQTRIPVSCREGPVVANNQDHVSSNMGFQELGGYLPMTSVTEHLADVMAKGRQDQLVVGIRPLRSRCSLQSVLQLTDLTAVAHLRQAGETAENTLCSATLTTYAVHQCRLRGRPGLRSEVPLVHADRERRPSGAPANLAPMATAGDDADRKHESLAEAATPAVEAPSHLRNAADGVVDAQAWKGQKIAEGWRKLVSALGRRKAERR
jgi:hypothetical protein